MRFKEVLEAVRYFSVENSASSRGFKRIELIMYFTAQCSGHPRCRFFIKTLRIYGDLSFYVCFKQTTNWLPQK